MDDEKASMGDVGGMSMGDEGETSMGDEVTIMGVEMREEDTVAPRDPRWDPVSTQMQQLQLSQ